MYDTLCRTHTVLGDAGCWRHRENAGHSVVPFPIYRVIVRKMLDFEVLKSEFGICVEVALS